jgi:biopolymer transport protein ExbD
MKIPSFTRHEERDEAMSMTPMIDVVFLLLIFFVCASIGQQKELLLSTPISGGAVQAETPPENLEQPKPDRVYLKLLRIDGSTVTDLDGRLIEEPDEVRKLLVNLATVAPDIPVVIDTAPEVPLGDMIGLYDICRSVDFETINFAISPKKPRIINE